MIRVLSTNIISPLGVTSEQNYQAVRSGRSALTHYEGKWELPETFAASLFSDEQNRILAVDGFSRFESLVLRSVREALLRTSFNIASPRVVFIMSTTKGNVEMLENDCDDENEYPGVTARKIARELGIVTEPVVVCNACISGVAAQILAQRLLEADLYDYAIVAGAEVQSRFIVSGFQSFKAVSDEPCRPFDIERLGLNLGEAAATIIYKRGADIKGGWHLTAGCVRNDAFHISAPSPKGDGYLLAMNAVLNGMDPSGLATVSVHGTATMYNDQMESKAVQRAGLSDVPLTALKGYYGHTMGAAGVVETILTMMATEEGIVPGARGFDEIGVSGKVNISNECRSTGKHSFLKMLSGFGGCNGAIMLTSEPECLSADEEFRLPLSLKTSHNVHISQDCASVDGVRLAANETGKQLLKALYKSYIDDYPKYYKMDMLTRLAFVASELLLKAEERMSEVRESGNPGTPEGMAREDRAVILFNRSSSIVADRQYMDTIRDADNFYASPSLFVYTLPNITTGEIAIRNHYTGETSFYILPERDDDTIGNIIRASFLDTKTRSVIGGWIDCTDENNFEANLSIYTL